MDEARAHNQPQATQRQDLLPIDSVISAQPVRHCGKRGVANETVLILIFVAECAARPGPGPILALIPEAGAVDVGT